ncbi:unnamed protein product [Symbiodinium natans]|uniref:Lipid-binding serum glycoprotein N-terminal domain-containing protein n=1 Tax=Symbiodinium natans TaxID=878477 RepID=A0A812R632_9DINO|nr:unnamed protein product [Symbiodinium natans]
MVLLTLTATAAGTAGAGVTWSTYGKRKMKSLAESLISKALAGSPCKLGSVDFSLSGGEMQIGVSGVDIGNLPPYKSESLLTISSVYVAVNLKSLVASGCQQVTVEELIVDGLQLTWEKIHVRSSNVKDLLHKMNHKESIDAAEPENEQDEQGTGLVPQVTDAVSTVAGEISHTASGLKELGQTAAAQVAAIAQPPQEKERKEAKVCIKTVHIKSIEVLSVNALTEGPLSFKAPPIRIESFSESHGTQKAAEMIQLLLKEILGSAREVVKDRAKDEVRSVVSSFVCDAASTVAKAAASVGAAFCPAVACVVDSVCVFWNFLSEPALPSK